MISSNSDFFLGVDIGGTKVAAGLVNARGELVHKERKPMRATAGEQDAMDCVRSAIDSVLEANPTLKPTGIGLSAPGSIDHEDGVVISATNLPCWHNFALAPAVENSYGIPATLHNDANAAGMAEAVWGAGADFRCVFYATIGTGIGTAIIFDQRLYLGRTGCAGEGGHMSIDFRGERCRCGKPGCIELLAAGPGIARRAKRKLVTVPEQGARLLELAGGNPLLVSSEVVARAWEDGDKVATEVLQETADLLAIWLGNIVDFLEPDVIVIGGGVSGLISRWFDRIRQQLGSWSVNPHAADIPLLAARFGSDSGIIGAASLCVAPGPHITR
jgi:glucokinase